MGRTNEGDIGQDEEEDEDEESFESLFENEYDGDEFEPTYWQLSRGVVNSATTTTTTRRILKTRVIHLR